MYRKYKCRGAQEVRERPRTPDHLVRRFASEMYVVDFSITPAGAFVANCSIQHDGAGLNPAKIRHGPLRHT